MSRKSSFIKALAEQLLTCPWQEPAMINSIYWLLDAQPTWVAPIVHRLLTQFPEKKAIESPALLSQFIVQDPGFQAIWERQRERLRIKRYNLTPLPTVSTIDCEQPPLTNSTQLAKWLGLSHGQLDSYAVHWRQYKIKDNPRRAHYHYLWRDQKHGKKRLIEAPKQRLAEVQRQIHLAILNKIPLHAACCGFRKGYSRIDYVVPHSGKKVVIKMDLLHFFNSIAFRRIHALFIALGYNPEVSRRLAGLCCNQTPRAVISLNPDLNWHQRQDLSKPHLPQGSPSSPALANLCAFRLDIRLSALAKKFGVDYSRYADDLAFSGNITLNRNTEKLTTWVSYIANDEGFSINHRKTKIMRQGNSQRLTGVTVNRFPNCRRKDFDQLKATLYNCVKYGPESQNRKRHPAFQAHLLGRIAEIRSLNPNRSAKLEALYKQICW